MKRLCIRLGKEAGPDELSVSIPVETEPGEVAQVDFGYVGKLYDPNDGRLRKAWVFIMVLAHSRFMVAEIVFDQKTSTWIGLHQRAFRALGGVPKVIVPDNLKAAVIRAAFGDDGECALNRSYRELARHFGFKIDPTPPRAPNKKGKVESAVKYVKNNFFKPREFADVHKAQSQLEHWLREIANLRIHGTTGQRPVEAFEGERAFLLSLPREPYAVVEWHQAKVHTDCHLLFSGRLYSAPWPLVGQQLWVKATPNSVLIFDDNERVATHPRHGEDKRSTQEAHLPEQRRDYRHRSRAYWEERAAALGDEVLTYVTAVFDSDDVLLKLRDVQNTVRHLEAFPKPRARRACVRALHFESLKYGTIKKILSRGLDFEPLPDERPRAMPLQAPRFARSPSEFAHPNLDHFTVESGEDHEYH